MNEEFSVIFKNPKFVALWTSQFLSQLTINIMNFVFLTYLYNATHSTIATSLMWIAFTIPAIIVGPIGAASVDLVSRRKMLAVTNLLQAITIFIYILINQVSIFILYFVVLLYSTFNQFYGPAESASLPSVVSKEMLARANSLFFITQQATLILGFGFAGVILKYIGFNGILVMCLIFLLLASLSVSLLPKDKPHKLIPGDFEKLLKTFFESILEGYDFIKNNKSILLPLLILLAIQAALAIIIVTLPQIATQILNISVNYAGVFIVVPAGIGALIGSFVIPRLVKNGWRKKNIIENSLILVTFALFAFSLGIPYLPVIFRLGFTILLIILSGLAFVGINIPTLTFLQESTPEWFRGRVFGNLWFMTSIVTIIPVLFSGAISEIFGVRTLFTFLGLVTLGTLIYAVKKGQLIIEMHFKENLSR